MNSLDIQIPRKLANQLLHLAQLSPDLEVCGLVSSQNGVPCHCYPVANVAEQPAQRFLLDAAAQIAAIKAMRDCSEPINLPLSWIGKKPLGTILYKYTFRPMQTSSSTIISGAWRKAQCKLVR